MIFICQGIIPVFLNAHSKTTNKFILKIKNTIANKIANSQIVCGKFTNYIAKTMAKMQRRLCYCAKEICKKVAQPQQNSSSNQICNPH